ncbi:3-methylornithyl-N6-L-lysine dehydrogenase PylD [Desulfobacula sp.]
MTRLTTNDIDSLSDQLTKFDENLKLQTGRDMLGIACHGAAISSKKIQNTMKSLNMAAVTMTSGLGKITGFAQTIKDILTHMGFNTFVPEKTDATGIACAIEAKADIIFMADDNRYIALNLKKYRLIDNIQATGNVFAAALDLMANGVKDQRALVLGCGPVGMAAARTLIGFGAHVAVHDKDMAKCRQNCCELEKNLSEKIELIHDLKSAGRDFYFFLEATTAKDVIDSSMIGPKTRIAAPGVPLGITSRGMKKAKSQLLYDPLCLGTAAMAVMAAVSDYTNIEGFDFQEKKEYLLPD